MATNSFSPVVPELSKDIMLGEGLLFANYGESGQAIIGATRGGSKLEIDAQLKKVDYDGSLGATKGMRRYEKMYVRLIVNFIKLTYVSMAYGLNVTITDGSDADGSYKQMTFKTSFSSADVLENITFKGFKANGEYCIIKVENALNINNIELDFKEKDEIVSEQTYDGFYSYSSPKTPPLKIQEEITA